MNKFEVSLEEMYRAIHESNGAPKWAVDIEPAIPFVGNDYEKKAIKCLIFGSAENLTYLGDNREITQNNYLRNRQVDPENSFFKNIHMAPITNGSLLTASRYILAQQGYDGEFSDEPRNFIEEVATVNFGKYSINSDRNIDTAGTLKYLKDSFHLLKADLEVLDPDIIILPKSIHDFAGVRAELFTKKRIIIPIYQTNNRVINSHLSNVNMSDSINEYPFVSKWLNETITGMDRYLSWLNNESVNT